MKKSKKNKMTRKYLAVIGLSILASMLLSEILALLVSSGRFRLFLTLMSLYLFTLLFYKMIKPKK